VGGDSPTRKGNIIIADLVGSTRHLGTTKGNAGPRKRLAGLRRIKGTEAGGLSILSKEVPVSVVQGVDVETSEKDAKAAVMVRPVRGL
jgi:hypothetical protein